MQYTSDTKTPGIDFIVRIHLIRWYHSCLTGRPPKRSPNGSRPGTPDSADSITTAYKNGLYKNGVSYHHIWFTYYMDIYKDKCLHFLLWCG